MTDPISSRPTAQPHLLIRIFLSLAALYGLTLSVLLILRNPLTDRHKIIGLFNTFAHLLLLPAMPLLLIAAITRRRGLAIVNALPALVFLSSYGDWFRPNRSHPISPSDLRVMTYNIHKEAANHIEGVVAVMRESGADIIAIQELSIEAAEVLSRELGDYFPYCALHPQVQAWRGQGIFSRYPITCDEYWQNEPNNGLGHQCAEIQVNSTVISVYNTHPVHATMTGLFFDTEPHRRETDVLLQKAAKEEKPVLILGDFNMADQTDDYRRIAARYHDTFSEVGYGMGLTFPDMSKVSDLPSYIPNWLRLPRLLRLDYIFHDEAFRALEARVWPCSGGSDHRPVFARLALREKRHD